MSTDTPILVFLIDDDELFLKSLVVDFAIHPEFNIQTYVTGELCIENLSQNPTVIILDYYLNGVDKHAINGIETLDIIKAKHPHIPVIMLSSQDNIDIAVDCMKHKAIDYIVKSETAFLRLQKTILSILDHQKIEKTLKWYMDKV
jgi:DNA-binding NarL/FixJ family response regulator